MLMPSCREEVTGMYLLDPHAYRNKMRKINKNKNMRLSIPENTDFMSIGFFLSIINLSPLSVKISHHPCYNLPLS
jgi:hypothetical protein